MRLPVAFVLSLFVASPLIAAEAGSEPAEAVKPEKPKKICRTTENVTGTRMTPPRTCKTADEWAADAERGEAQLRNINKGAAR